MKSFWSSPGRVAGRSTYFPRVYFLSSASRRCRTKDIANPLTSPNQAPAVVAMSNPEYRSWSNESLIERVTQLENELKNRTSNFTQPAPKIKTWKKPRQERIFDPSKYSTRLVAFKLAYLGKNYNGFEHHLNNSTPLPTIEEVLWKAFIKARLIFPTETSTSQQGEVNWEGCDYSKCGRTDKGVSAFGQVIGLRVRSNRRRSQPKQNPEVVVGEYATSENLTSGVLPDYGFELASPPLSDTYDLEEHSNRISLEDEAYEDLAFDPIADELPYASILNHLLPPDVRILAWCPAPPLDFSARFSCRERQYKYFFTQPAFVPLPQHLDTTAAKNKPSMKDGWLNIKAMREAARQFVGVHDFRNFCKVDPSKQISNFERHIFHADIVEVEDTSSAIGFVNGADFLPSKLDGSENINKDAIYPKVYTFTLHGSAFLWHQVRCMVAILFLVGQGLEPPTIISELLDVQKNPCKPTYDMASDTPLVLWDCVFPQEGDEDRKDAIQWLYVGDEMGAGDAKYGSGGLIEDLWEVWRERKVDEILAGSLVDVVVKQGSAISELTSKSVRKGPKSQKVFDGDDRPRLQGNYIPVMKKPRMDTVQAINEKYAVRKGFDNAEDMRIQGYKRLNKPSVIIDDADE